MRHMTKPLGQAHPYVRGPRVDYTWSARFLFERPHTFDEAVRKLGGLVTGFADPAWPVSGAVIGSGEAADRTTLVLGLDPSRSFGAPDIGRCETIAAQITDSLGWQRQTEDLPELRVILGRRVGYEGTACTMEAVRGLSIARGCAALALTEADLFSLRYVAGVIIEGPARELASVLQMAADISQERLVAEMTGQETQVYLQPHD